LGRSRERSSYLVFVSGQEIGHNDGEERHEVEVDGHVGKSEQSVRDKQDSQAQVLEEGIFIPHPRFQFDNVVTDLEVLLVFKSIGHIGVWQSHSHQTIALRYDHEGQVSEEAPADGILSNDQVNVDSLSQDASEQLHENEERREENLLLAELLMMSRHELDHPDAFVHLWLLHVVHQEATNQPGAVD